MNLPSHCLFDKILSLVIFKLSASDLENLKELSSCHSDCLIPIYLEPNVGVLRYFRL